MSEVRYKAFISYSHQDVRWARWLHRTLEAYRVPARLRGMEGNHGPVPDRLRPVFRDREDLSAAHSLTEEIQRALTHSENLIIICSPAARASQWVDEEIRFFRSIGKGDHIYSLIVDGDPQAKDPGQLCFPKTLVESEGSQAHEPLASDLRKWADGRQLAKQKLIAAILGIPLDLLRRREHQRQIRRRMLLGTMVLGLTVLAFFGLSSWWAAEQRRDSGEMLVAMKLNELRSVLDVKTDPESLQRLENWPISARTSLWESASADDGDVLEVSLALRENGIFSWESGDFTGALKLFQEAWLLNAMLFRERMDDAQVYFELGQAEFWIGQAHYDLGNMQQAEDAFTAYAEITRRLIQADPENAEWVLEMTYALTNLGFMFTNQGEGRSEKVLQVMQSALEYNQIALVLDPGNRLYSAELGQSLANLAYAQLEVCDLEGALETTEASVDHELDSLQARSEDYDHQRNLAAALGSRARLLLMQGDTRRATSDLERSHQYFEELRALHPDDMEIVVLQFERQARLARIEGIEGAPGPALAKAMALEQRWSELIASDRTPGVRWQGDYVHLLLIMAELSRLNGDQEAALIHAQSAMSQASDHLARTPNSGRAKRQLIRGAFQAWEQTRLMPEAVTAHGLSQDWAGQATHSCSDAVAGLHLALMNGDAKSSSAYGHYLHTRGLRDVDFLRLCSTYSVCPGF